MQPTLTDRHLREIDYHRERATKLQDELAKPMNWDVLKDPGKRWWNPAWRMFYRLSQSGLQGKNVLVLGCGFGEDALRVAKFGARVSALDISPESLAIARRRAEQHSLDIDFRESPAESIPFPDGYFDAVLARDILHHVEIDLAMQELQRVCKPDAVFIANEIYTHSAVEAIRRSFLIDKVLYPRMRKFIYRNPLEDYTTEDEEKLCQKDIRLIEGFLQKGVSREFFNFAVARIVPKGVPTIAKADRLILAAAGPLGAVLAGRILLCGRIKSRTA